MVNDFWEELKDIVREKIKYFYGKFRYLLLLLFLVIFIIAIFFCTKKEPESIESQQIYMFDISIENWSLWIAIITIPYTAGWTIYQFRKNSLAKKQEKAVEIAKEFSDTLVDNFFIINNVYINSSLKKYIPYDEEMVSKLKYFNVEEIRRIFKKDDYVSNYKAARKQLREELDNLYHIELYKQVVSYSEFKHIEEMKEKILKNTLTQDEKNKIEEKIKQINGMPYHFSELINKTLNKLEYICMDISSKAADSNYIYQSLHQIFLRTIRTLYLEISHVNINSTDKFYINIIHVYNIWKDKYMQEKKLEERRIKRANEEINPKIKTV